MQLEIVHCRVNGKHLWRIDEVGPNGHRHSLRTVGSEYEARNLLSTMQRTYLTLQGSGRVYCPHCGELL